MSPASADHSRASAEAESDRGRWELRWRQRLLVLLAFTSGATDAIGLISFGGAFTSVMTGNMVLLGIALPDGDGALAVRSGLAIVLFMLGAFVGARIARTPQPGDGVWPQRVTAALATELAIFGAVAVVWWAQGGEPTGPLQPVLLGAAAVALGIQSSAIMRFGVSGLSTTYMTGTLTAVVVALANGRHPRNVASSAQMLVALIAGAAAAAALDRYASLTVPTLQLVPVGLVVALAAMGWFVRPAEVRQRSGSPE